MQAQVLVVGGGPVGMTLAMDLAWRGIDVIVAERRGAGERPNVKCNSVAARTMEIFRRLGVAEQVRHGGLPVDYPQHASYRITTVGQEISRIPMPASQDRYTRTEGPDCQWPTPEPQQHINQIFLEPILFEHLRAMPNVRILSRTEIEAFEQSDDGVTATARDLDSGTATTISCRYMIGCDGGRSMVRKALGIRFNGDALIQRVQSTYLRAPTLIGLMAEGPAWCMTSFNPRRCGNVYAIDGRETFLIFNYLKEHETDFDQVDRDGCLRAILGVGSDFDYEVISKEDWVGRRLLADRFRAGRVFLCGDAAHIWVPYGGYGMNAGIADAANLAWLLAAHLKGWAPAAILDAHEAERGPVTEQVSHFAMGSGFTAIRMRRDIPAAIEAPGPEGDALRATIGREAYDISVVRLCAAGLNFGYFYPASPLIAYDGETAPGYTMNEFTASTVPGCRLPHFWTGGRSLYDLLGPDYTLLRLDPWTDVTRMMDAFARCGVPLKQLDADAEDAPACYKHKLLLVRPDQHVAWRSNHEPADPMALANRVRGGALPNE